MKKRHFEVLVPGVFAATALALAVGVGAQMSPAPTPNPAGKTPQAAPMAGHSMHHGAEGAKQVGDMKPDCQAMMARKQEMQDKHQAMDATLDKLVAEMNVAQGSKAVTAAEKSMAAVLNELVAQRKAMHSMMMEMQPMMMGHMTHHMGMHGEKGAMECPMMKKGMDHEAKAEENKP